QNKLILCNGYFEDGKPAGEKRAFYKQGAGVRKQQGTVEARYIKQSYTDRDYRYENYDTDALEKKGRQEEREYILLPERALHNREEKTYSAPEKMSPYAIENMHYKWDRLYRHTEEKMYLIFERISKHTAEKMPEPVEWDAEISTSEYTLIMRGGDIEKQLAIGYERFLLRGTEKANAVFGIRNVAWEYAINRLVKNESKIQKSVAEKITGWNVIVQNKISLYENSKQKNLEEKITRWDRNIQNKLILWNGYFKDGRHVEERGGIYKQRAGVIGQQDIVKAQYINQLYIDRNYRYENYDIDTLTKKSRQEERKYIFLPERTLHNSEGKFFLQEREKTDAAFNIRNAAWEYAINGLVTNESRLKKSIAEKITRWNKIVQNKLAFWVENVEKTVYSFYKAAVSAKSEDVSKTLKLIDEKYMMQFPANESAKYADSELIQKKYFWHDREESSKKIIHLTRDNSGSGAVVREQKLIQNEINELKHDLTEEIHKNVMERETMKLLEEKIIKQQEQIEELENMYYKVEKSFWAIQDSQEQERAYSRIFGNEIKLERMRHGIAPI
ncbi:MAG: hypothetical protein HFH72_15115, partial [Lachnospiraceae bacterium]|nr:hypothetical protein [Lachnospiraceae bacterium]